MPCVDALDRAAWRRAWRIAGDAPVPRRLDPAGLPEFRVVVGEHLLRHRGLLVGPSEIVATTGSTAAPAELARGLPAGAPIAVEDPGYAAGAAALGSAGHRVVGVPVDGEGLIVEAVPPGVAAVCVTPAPAPATAAAGAGRAAVRGRRDRAGGRLPGSRRPGRGARGRRPVRRAGPAERRITAATAALGVEVDGLARHHRGSGGRPGLVLGYAGPTRAELDRALAVVARVLAAARA